MSERDKQSRAGGDTPSKEIEKLKRRKPPEPPPVTINKRTGTTTDDLIDAVEQHFQEFRNGGPGPLELNATCNAAKTMAMLAKFGFQHGGLQNDDRDVVRRHFTERRRQLEEEERKAMEGVGKVLGGSSE
jgi:hypothetical protein